MPKGGKSKPTRYHWPPDEALAKQKGRGYDRREVHRSARFCELPRQDLAVGAVRLIGLARQVSSYTWRTQTGSQSRINRDPRSLHSSRLLKIPPSCHSEGGSCLGIRFFLSSIAASFE